jgi:hypothetical protein
MKIILYTLLVKVIHGFGAMVRVILQKFLEILYETDMDLESFTILSGDDGDGDGDGNSRGNGFCFSYFYEGNGDDGSGYYEAYDCFDGDGCGDGNETLSYLKDFNN